MKNLVTLQKEQASLEAYNDSQDKKLSAQLRLGEDL